MNEKLIDRVLTSNDPLETLLTEFPELGNISVKDLLKIFKGRGIAMRQQNNYSKSWEARYYQVRIAETILESNEN